MKPAMDCGDGSYFQWQDTVYIVIGHASIKGSDAIDHVIVQEVMTWWPTQNEWTMCTARIHERFNPYCEVRPGKITIQFDLS